MIEAIVPSLILSLGAADDLWKRKVHNALFVFCLVLALGFSFYSHGVAGLAEAFLSGGLAFFLTFILFYFRVLGGGDVKIFAAFGASTTTTSVLNVMFFAIVWGAFLGVVISILNKNLPQVGKNLIKLLKFEKPEETNLHKIPFTIALLLGWVTQIIFVHYGSLL